MNAGGPVGAGGGGAVFRRIWHQYYTPGLPISVAPEAFRPTDADTDGISVVDAAKATPEQALSGVAPEKHDLYYVARIPIAFLQQLGLSVRDAPIEGCPGHAVIPEMTAQAYQANKVVWKEKQKALAQVASANIVLTPPSAKMHPPG
jgi:hypothetical protein